MTAQALTVRDYLAAAFGLIGGICAAARVFVELRLRRVTGASEPDPGSGKVFLLDEYKPPATYVTEADLMLLHGLAIAALVCLAIGLLLWLTSRRAV